ncbi:4953_t:CDS:1, partial [Gigaspora rosea]
YPYDYVSLSNMSNGKEKSVYPAAYYDLSAQGFYYWAETKV